MALARGIGGPRIEARVLETDLKHLSVARAYWVLTALFCALMTFSAAGDLFRFEPFVADLQRLGYPLYVMTLLGVAKLLGVAALSYPGLPRLKEWAYAGFAFDLGGATISQWASGSTPAQIMPPLFCGSVLAACYLAHRLRDREERYVAPVRERSLAEPGL